VVLAVLATVVVAVAGSGHADPARITLTGPGTSVGGVLQAAGLLFFAFAGYARIATLGEEVRDPAHTIPRAVRLSLAIALAVYATVAVTVLTIMGPGELATAPAPLVDAVRAAGATGLSPVVQAGAVVAALGSLLSLILGVSRTSLAMARDGYLPSTLAAVHPRFGVPHHAEVVVGVVVAAVASVADVRGAIGFSSFAVLLYYGIANVSAWTLNPRRRLTPAVGLAGCLLLAVTLPRGSVMAGLAVVLVGATIWAVQRFR
jgi:APA family basic amino acid/polyamine antiporter